MTCTRPIHMIPIDVVYQNFPHCEQWRDESFLGMLHEDARLDMSAYWWLEWALVSLTNKDVNYPKHLIWPVFRIFSCIMNLLQANTNPADGYVIARLTGTQDAEFKEREFTERVQLVFEGFFRGEVPDLTLAFDEENPLLR